MSKKAKGKRPVYFDDPQIDKMLAIIMALTAEVSVLRDRLDTLEHLIQDKGIISIADIETYQPDEQVTKEREQRRAEYIARVFRIVQEELEAIQHH